MTDQVPHKQAGSTAQHHGDFCKAEPLQADKWGCAVAGELPEWTGGFPRVQLFGLSSNQLGGVLPDIWNFPSLRTLEVRHLPQLLNEVMSLYMSSGVKVVYTQNLIG